jgi:hypothetical protein
MRADAISNSEVSNFAAPRISYTSATRARFIWHDELHTIGTCPLEVLTEFLAHYAVCARLPAHQLTELHELLAYGEIGRWQAIDTLLFYRVVLPLEYMK